MTPPKLLPLRLDPPAAWKDSGLHFLPDLQLKLAPGFPLGTPDQPGKYSLLGGQALAWSPPSLWTPRPFPYAPPSAPPAAAPVAAKDGFWSGAETFKFITDVLLLVESLDAKGSNMISNGGEGGCRYEEMAKREEARKLMDKCLVKFEPNTHASVVLQLRKMRGADESLISAFRVGYDKNIYKDEFPDNQVRVQGFQFTPRPEKAIPFGAEIDPLTADGYSIRYMVEGAAMLAIPLLGYPIFKLKAEPSDKLDLTRDFLLSLGLEKPADFAEAHTGHFLVPQKVADFMKLVRHIETDDDKLSVVNINKLKGRPSLFDWLSFERIDWVSQLRAGKLEVPHFGAFSFSRKAALQRAAGAKDEEARKKILSQASRLEIHGTKAGLAIELSNVEIDEAHFKIGDQDVTIKGMSAGKIRSTLPGLQELIRQIKAGTFGLDKLGVQAEDLFVEELSIRDSKNQITTQLKNANLKTFSFNGSDNISAQGVQADSLDVQSGKLNAGFKIEKASVAEVRFTRKNGLEEISMPRIEGGKTLIRYSNTTLKAEQSLFEGLNWAEGPEASRLSIQQLSSSGSIHYEAPSGLSFETRGSSQLRQIKLSHEKSGRLNASLELAGKVQKLELNQGMALQLKLNEAEFGPSQIAFGFQIDPQSQALESIQYNCSFDIKSTEVGLSQIGPVTVAPSSLKNGRLKLAQAGGLLKMPHMDLSGNLDIRLQTIAGSNESFNIPGLSVSGSINEISLKGPARFRTTLEGWVFEKVENAQGEKIQATAQIRQVDFSHDPHLVPGNNLKKWPHNEVVKTQMLFKSADLSIGDIERIEFANRLRNVELRNIRFTNLQASGVAWAKFPLFYYMRGLFPEIGARQKDTLVNPSFTSLDRFSIQTPDEGPTLTLLEGFKGEVYEVAGDEKFAKVNIPLLRIHPEGETLVDTGDQPTEIELYLIDKARGGWIRLHSVPRPLEKRRSRIVAPPPSPSKP